MQVEYDDLPIKLTPVMTLEEVAEKLGITKEMARQLERQALKKLRHPSLREQWKQIREILNELDRDEHD